MMRCTRYAASFAAGLAVTLALIEVFLRASGAGPSSFVRDDPRFGVVPRPGAEIVHFAEGMRLDRVNMHGFLGPDVDTTRTPGVPRVALVGDSYVEGFQMPDAAHLRGRLQQWMETLRGGPVEVLNFGFSGFNFPRMWHYHREVVERFHPDVVVYVVGPTDLVAPALDIGPRYRVEDGRVVVDTRFAESAAYRRRVRLAWLRRFGLYGLARSALDVVRRDRWRPIVLGKFDRLLGGAESTATEDAGVGAAAVSPARRALVEAILDDLERIERERGERIVVVEKTPFPDGTRRAFEARGITRVSAEEVFRTLRAKGIDPRWWEATRIRGHWNPTAHDALAKALAPVILSLLDSGERSSR